MGEPSRQRLVELVERAVGDQLHPDIRHHSHRVLAIAYAEAEYAGWAIPFDELAVAALFHDAGTIPDDSDLRFEVVGAQRAYSFARDRLGLGDDACRRIWYAIALHTSPGLAEQAGPLTRAIRAGVVADFGDARLRDRHRDLIGAVERDHPRGAIEASLADAVVTAAVRCPAKAPRPSWPHDLVVGHRQAPAAPVNPLF